MIGDYYNQARQQRRYLSVGGDEVIQYIYLMNGQLVGSSLINRVCGVVKAVEERNTGAVAKNIYSRLVEHRSHLACALIVQKWSSLIETTVQTIYLARISLKQLPNDVELPDILLLHLS